MADIRRPEEPIRVRLDQHPLDTIAGRAPDGEAAVAVMIGEDHDEAALVLDEERGRAVAQALTRLGQAETDLPDRSEHTLAFLRSHGHVPILPYDRGVDEPARYLVYSITKTYLGVLCLRLGLDLAAPIATWIDDARLPDASLRQLLNHTSGTPDYGRLAAYHEAVRDRPSDPWDDEELLARALAQGPDFPPGDGWAYSNTGYLLVRRIVDLVADGGFPGALERELLRPLELERHVARSGARRSQRARSRARHADDVRGRYHPCWVGHRTLASTVADQTRFWTALAAGELCDLDVLTESVEIGRDAPGFHRPSYGLGVMTDPRPDGLLIGHGGGGPGYAAAAFALLRPQAEPRVVVPPERRRARRRAEGGAQPPLRRSSCQQSAHQSACGMPLPRLRLSSAATS